MNLREVREAAEYQKNWYGSAEGGEYIFKKHLVMCNYILATIDPSPDEPITEQWLQEEWGFKKAEWSRRIVYENGHASMINVYDNCWNYEDDEFEWPRNLHTRQQFCDLARCLGIPRRKDGAK